MHLVTTLMLMASLTATQPAGVPPKRPVDLRFVIERATWQPAEAPPLPRAAVAAPQGQKRSTARTVAGIVVGGAVGFWAGAAIGFKIEHVATNGRCYDVCFKGLVIGAPIGALAGALIGWKLF